MISSRPVERSSTGASAAATHTSRGAGNALRDHPITAIVIACLLVGVLSVLLLSWLPSSDPWAWIDWGQEIANPGVAFGFAGGPSWKPFPVIFTTVFGFFGSAAPSLWLVVARTASALAIVGMFRLGRRFGGTAAGVLAVVALCLLQDWVFYIGRGASEPIVVATALWAIDRQLNGSPRVAYVILFLGALNRPEFSVILFLYGVYLWLRVPGSRTLVIGLLVLVPVAWLGFPGIVSGDFLQAEHAAAGGQGSPGSAIAELRSSAGLISVPTLILAAIGFAIACARREITLIWLGAGAIAWALMVALMTQAFYGLPRYLLPAAAIGCLMAALAVVWIAEWAGSLGGGNRGAERARAITCAAGAAVLALTLPWSIARVKTLYTVEQQNQLSAGYVHDLFLAADRAGGARVVLPCPTSYVAVNHTLASALAFKLRVPERRVKPVLRTQGYAFSAPHTSVTGTTPVIVRLHVDRVRVVATAHEWLVYAVSRPAGGPNAICPGR